jgi:Sugar (and other) transporter
MQYFFPGILLLIFPFFPESAYYLIKRGKPAEARKALSRVHGGADQNLIDSEMARLEKNVRTSEELKKEANMHGPAFYQCFMGTNLVPLLASVL